MTNDIRVKYVILLKKKRIIIITETAIYKDQRGITKIHKGYGAYHLQVVLFCLIFVCISSRYLEWFSSYRAGTIL